MQVAPGMGVAATVYIETGVALLAVAGLALTLTLTTLALLLLLHDLDVGGVAV